MHLDHCHSLLDRELNSFSAVTNDDTVYDTEIYEAYAS